MRSTLLDLKRRSRALGLCGDYTSRWDGCKDHKDLVDTATDYNGMRYLSDVCTFKWGGFFDTSYISETFESFVNGRYQRDKGGYTTRLYTNHVGLITIDSTITCLLHCKGHVFIPEGRLCTLIIGDDSNITINGITRGCINELIIYGNSTVKYRDRLISGKVVNITQSEWKKE